MVRLRTTEYRGKVMTRGSIQSALAFAHAIHACFSGVSSPALDARSSTAAMNSRKRLARCSRVTSRNIALSFLRSSLRACTCTLYSATAVS